MKGNVLVTMASGLLGAVLGSLISVFTISASIEQVDFPLHELLSETDQPFTAPFSGDATLISEIVTNGCLIWGAILVTREKDGESYELPVPEDKPTGCPEEGADWSRENWSRVMRDGNSLTGMQIDDDENILCHIEQVRARTEDRARPARLIFICPGLTFTKGETYRIINYIEDLRGTANRSDAKISYYYRKPVLF